MATSTTKRSTTPGKTTAGKATTGAPVKAAAKAPVTAQKKTAPAATAAPAPKLVSVSDPVVAEADLKKKELIDLVVERSGIKKKDAKPVIEAMLAVLGETIASGRELNLQPLGKLRINRTADKGNGRIIVCKLRQSTRAQNAAKDKLAEAPDKL